MLKQSTNPNGYKAITLLKSSFRITRTVHQLVAEAFLDHKPCGPLLVVDHINDRRDDNRVSNLRIVTTRENNTKKSRGTSKYMGVFWCKSSLRWVAEIRIGDKKVNLGYYRNEKNAKNAYNSKRKEVDLDATCMNATEEIMKLFNSTDDFRKNQVLNLIQKVIQ